MLESSSLESFRDEVRTRLTSLRQQARLSQTSLAAELGIDQSIVSRVEAGTRDLGLDEVFAWGEALGLPPAETAELLLESWVEFAARRKGYWS